MLSRDDVLRMAREAQDKYPTRLYGPGQPGCMVLMSEESLVHLAALVAAAEREACAKVCRKFMAACDAAAAIRARKGETNVDR